MQDLIIENYLKDVFNTAKRGDAREESYYPDLKNFLESYADKNNKSFSVTSLPKKTEGGNPDFRVWDGKNKIVGYIEAKDIKVENLDFIEDLEQLERYKGTFPNLILTNFFEFRLYRNGQLIDKVQVGRPFIIRQLRTVPPIENREKFLKLLEKFFAFSIPKTTTAKSLAIELAKRTRFLRDNVIAEELKEEGIKGTQTLEGFYKAFKEHLIPLLSLRDFSNLFAQTITYGLFAARTRAENDFNRELAYKFIPATIGILRDVFRFISSTDLPESMSWIIDDIAEVLQVSQVKEIMENFYREGKGKDPVIHFYETFLAEYDSKEREKRGVYYTPEPVVSYIVRSIHKLLKEKFGKEDGFATQSVTVLDPASGTLTFPAEAIRLAIEETKNKYGEGSIQPLIKDHILKNFYAFELMMAPYAIGHLKIGFVLDEYGYRLKGDERFNLFLTNTLDFTKEDPNKFIFIEQTLARESQEALKVKEEVPIMVVMGNPPYSVSSTNIIKEGSEFYKLYESYKEIVRKEERNIQPLSDDYIKFIAFAHWKIKQAGQGIIGMITNNSYLDGLIHRDMRQKLLDDFDERYVLNLHGSSKRQENKPAEISKDENVFDIQQGVSIMLLVKNPGHRENVKYYDLWDTREEKYYFLEHNDFSTIKWQLITPIEPFFFLTVKDFAGSEKYESFTLMGKIFKNFTAGIVTGKDDALTDEKSDALKHKMISILNSSQSNDLIKTAYDLNNSAGNKILSKRQSFQFDESKLKKYHYRPLDYKYIYYEPEFLERHRFYLASSMCEQNLAISVSRLTANNSFTNVIVSDCLADYKLAESSRGSYFFPLYTYNQSGQQDLLAESGKSTNLLWNNLPYSQGKVSSEQVFYYIYAILYSNVYRQKYQEFLKIDFPRIPFTKDYNLFIALAQRGEQLVNLHLLKSRELENPSVKFYGRGDNRIEKREYDKFLKRVNINNLQYFDGIKPEVWNYQIGGYQVLDKWLKDRKGRVLPSEDIKHYCKVATALSKTIEIQKEIDKIYQEVEKSLIS